MIPMFTTLDLSTVAHCIHTLALLLHSVGHAWGTVPFPLELILNGDKFSTGKDVYETDYYTSLGGEKVSLRQRLCKLVEEGINEGNGEKVMCLSIFLLHILHMEDHTDDDNKKTEIWIIRSAVFRILVHLTIMCHSFARRVILSAGFNVSQSIVQFLQDQNTLAKNSVDHDVFSHGLALLTLSNFVKANCLPYSQMISCTNVALLTLSSNDDVRLTTAASSLLSSMLLHVINYHPSQSRGDMESPIVTLSQKERQSVIYAICHGILTNSTVINVLCNIIVYCTTPNDANELGTELGHNVPKMKGISLWLLGIEFGMRSGGLVDEVVQLFWGIAHCSLQESLQVEKKEFQHSDSSGNIVSTFLSSSTALKIAGYMCKSLQSAVCVDIL
jgi:hypothetical protein